MKLIKMAIYILYVIATISFYMILAKYLAHRNNIDEVKVCKNMQELYNNDVLFDKSNINCDELEVKDYDRR